MWTAWLLLTLNGLFFTLRLSGGGGSFPRPLKREEEEEYLKRMAEGDPEARSALIEHNLRLVAHIIKKYYTQAGDQDDLISIGTIGLIKGVSTFKPDKNVRLATYASRCIENAILTQRTFCPHMQKIKLHRMGKTLRISQKRRGASAPRLFLAVIENGFCYRIDQFQFLFSGTIQLFYVLKHILSVEFRRLFIQLGLFFRCFRVMDDDIYWLPLLFHQQLNICGRSCPI